MRINATGRARSSGRITSKKSASSSSAFALQEHGPAQAAKKPVAVSAASPLASVDSLIALQEGEDFRRARKMAAKRAGDLLDALAQMRLGLLEGGVPLSALQRLSAALQQSRAQTGDLRMESVLDEIEVRAAVEKAKFETPD